MISVNLYRKTPKPLILNEDYLSIQAILCLFSLRSIRKTISFLLVRYLAYTNLWMLNYHYYYFQTPAPQKVEAVSFYLFKRA